MFRLTVIHWFEIGAALVVLTLGGLMAGSFTDFLIGVSTVTLLYVMATNLEGTVDIDRTRLARALVRAGIRREPFRTYDEAATAVMDAYRVDSPLRDLDTPKVIDWSSAQLDWRDQHGKPRD